MSDPGASRRESLAGIDVEVLQLVLDQLPIGLAVYGPDRRLKLWNAMTLRILHLPPKLMAYNMRFEQIARYIAEQGGYGTGAPEDLAAARVEAAFGQAYHRTEFRSAEGGTWEAFSRRLEDDSLLCTYADVTEYRAREQWVQDLAYQDLLTGLANRRAFFAALEAQRRDGARFAVAVADLDGFKSVNDRHGHLAGDALLSAVAARLGERLGEGDLLARLGGDEFGLMIPQAGQAGRDLTGLLDELRNACAEPFVLPQGERAQIGVSIGLARHPDDGDTVRDLLRVADMRMYAEKQRNPSGHP